MSITLHSCGDLKTGDTTDKTAPSSPSVSIDSGASSTTSTSVTLTLSATDNVGVTGYYASETSTTPSENATGWTSVTSATNYSATVSFTLSSGNVGDNTKTVYVWFRDTAGNVSASANDSITLTVVVSIWETKAPMPTARHGAAGGVINGKLYVVGGWTGTNSLATLEVYDPTTDTWTTKSPMPTARGGVSGGVINDKLYVVGGDNGSKLATLEVYDPTTDTWTTKSPMPTARGGVSGGVINDKLYVVGGDNGSKLATLEVYDPATDTWTTKAPMPTARGGVDVAVVNGLFYVMGGCCGYVSSDSDLMAKTIEVYNPTTNTWTTKTQHLVGSYGTAGYINGKIYVAEHAATEVYDPATDTWASLSPMPTVRYYVAGGVINDKFYVAGGHDETGETAALEALTPGLTETDKTPPSSPSVTINNGDASTTSTSATLSLSATDDVGVTAYYASETSTTPSASATGWTTVTSTTSYSATISFALSSGDGTKTVYVWFKDAAGNVSTVASDSITLETIIASVSNITDASATLNASFSNVSGASVTVHFEYGTTADYGTTTSAQVFSFSSVDASANLTNLNGGTTYHYRVVVVYNDSTVQTGMDHSFTTLVTPTTLLGGANNIATMTLNGGSLYWIDSSGLKSIACAGCQVTTITGSVTSGGHLQVNGTAAYWIDSTYDPDTGQTSYIKTIPLTGGSISTLVTTTVKYYIADMKVDSSSIYWMDYYSTSDFSGDASLNGSGGLRKIPLDGGTTTTIASTNYGSYIALDGSSVYWTDNSGLHKADKNGGTLTVLDSNLFGNLTVDSTSIYVGGGLQGIYKMPLQGGTSTMLADSSEFASLTIILSDGLNVYWGGVLHPPHLGNYQIDKVTSTGGSSTLIASGTGAAFGGIVDMSLDDANIYWSTSSEIKKLSK